MFEERSSVFRQNNSRFGIIKCLFSHIRQSILVTERERLKLHVPSTQKVLARYEMVLFQTL